MILYGIFRHPSVRQCGYRSYTVCVRKQNQINSNLTGINSSLQSSNFQWHLYAGLLLQRPPLIGPELNWLERRMSDLLTRVEISESLYSDHEMRHFEDLRRSERIAKGVDVDEKDLEDAAKQTAQDFEEQSLEEAKQFRKANRVTKADLTNNQKSIDRSLDKYLYLTVKHQLGSQPYWLLPQQLYQPELDHHSLRNTAERCYQNLFPNEMKDDSLKSSKKFDKKFLGNSPCSIYQYRYPKEVATESGKIGSRIFFFKCNLFFDRKSKPKSSALSGQFGEQILAPNLKTSDELNCLQDYAWLTYRELSEAVPRKYWQDSLGKTLYPDEIVDIEKLAQINQKSRFSRMSKRLRSFDQELTNKQQQQQSS